MQFTDEHSYSPARTDMWLTFVFYSCGGENLSDLTCIIPNIRDTLIVFDS